MAYEAVITTKMIVNDLGYGVCDVCDPNNPDSNWNCDALHWLYSFQGEDLCAAHLLLIHIGNGSSVPADAPDEKHHFSEDHSFEDCPGAIVVGTSAEVIAAFGDTEFKE